jgi:diaminopimelate decarboxylase
MKNTLTFLNEEQVRDLGKLGTPTYVLSKRLLKENAGNIQSAMKALPFGGSLSFAMKANPHPEVLKLFADLGVGMDASSYYEAVAAMDAGVDPKTISLTSQELPKKETDFKDLIDKGLEFNASTN